MEKSATDIIENLIKMVILPKYPFLKLQKIDYFGGTAKWYGAKFSSKKELDTKIQQEIDTELKTLFNIAHLDKAENAAGKSNMIGAWFKQPRSRSFTFNSSGYYKHYL